MKAAEERLKAIRKYVSEMEAYYSGQHEMFGGGDELSAERRLSLFCAHLIGKIDEK